MSTMHSKYPTCSAGFRWAHATHPAQRGGIFAEIKSLCLAPGRTRLREVQLRKRGKQEELVLSVSYIDLNLRAVRVSITGNSGQHSIISGGHHWQLAATQLVRGDVCLTLPVLRPGDRSATLWRQYCDKDTPHRCS